MRRRFLGTGAADWNGPDERGEWRRHTAALIDGKLLIDCTEDALPMLPAGARVQNVLLTHSHADHYQPEALRRIAPARVWAHESWAADVATDGLPASPARFGEALRVEGIEVTPLPANHTTERAYEETCNYLLERDGKRLLYMTDGAWLTRRASLWIGPEPLDGIVMEATIGPEHGDDWRVFEHTSAQMAEIMTNSLLKSGRLRPGAKVWLTHMARTLWPCQAESERAVRAPFVVAYDGLEANI